MQIVPEFQNDYYWYHCYLWLLRSSQTMFCLGSTSKITDQNLKGTDIDSDNVKLRYVMTKDPSVGRLQMSKGRDVVQISIKGPVKSFTQEDVNKGFIYLSVFMNISVRAQQPCSEWFCTYSDGHRLFRNLSRPACLTCWVQHKCFVKITKKEEKHVLSH